LTGPATVGFHPDASHEADSAYDWYAARDVSVAHAFRQELRHAVDAVANNPLAWPRRGRNTRHYVFPRFPYSLVYRMRGDEIEVIAVAHGRRRPGYWRSRL
jgi:plasmid stabilization system protein ParE